MRLGIMQPYFFPYLGHFSLIAAVDEWVVFDLSQYTPRSWMNRNRVMHPAGGAQWLSVPLVRSTIHMRTHEAMVRDVAGVGRSILGRLGAYRGAPYYRAVVDLVGRVFDTGDASLTRLNARGLAAVCGYLGVPFQYRIASELGLELPERPGAGGWAPALCGALGATGYVNPASGRGLFAPADFTRLGVELAFLRAQPFVYRTGRMAFEPDLSILDVLMWNAPEEVLGALRRYTLQSGQSCAMTEGWTLRLG